MSTLQYKVVITGHRPPFKWTLRSPSGLYPSERIKTGESDSYTDALSEATDAARAWDDERVHAATQRTEVVLEVDSTVPQFDPFDSLEPINR